MIQPSPRPLIFGVVVIAGYLLFACQPRDSVSAATTEYLYAETPAGEIASYGIADNGSMILAGKLQGAGAILAQRQHISFWPGPIWLVVQPGGEFGYSSNPFDFPRSTADDLESYRVKATNGVLEANPAANPHFPADFGPPIFTPDGRILLWDKVPHAVDSATGQLTKIGKPLTIGQIDAIAFGPDGNYDYALSRSTASVFSFRVLANGSSQRIGAAPAGGDANAIVADPSGSFAYVTNSADDTISQYFIDPVTGALRPNPKARTIDIHYGPTSMVIGASGEFLYAVAWLKESANMPRAAALHRFHIAADGTLQPVGTPINLPGEIASHQTLMIDPSGKFLYLRHEVADDQKGVGLTGFRTLRDGSLAPLKPNSVSMMDDTVPAISWTGPKPYMQVVARDVAPLAAIKTPLAGSFTEINSGGMILLQNASGTVMPDGRVFIIQLVWGKIQAEIYDPKTGKFSPAKNVPDEAGAVLLISLKDGRFMLWHGGKDSTVQIFDPATMKLLPRGHLIKECNNASWTLGDGRVLFHYSPPYRWNACGGEIYDPATSTAVEEPADLQKMDILAQLSDDKLLVVQRSSLPEEILPWDDDFSVPIPISIYDVATGINESRPVLSHGVFFIAIIFYWTTGDCSSSRRFCFTSARIMRNCSIREPKASRI
jgi:DNA-binding beta-propeller fold protein YncE